MAIAFTPSTVIPGASAINTINNNFATISTQLQRAVSRYADTPNTMQSTFDLNNNRVLNAPAPIYPTDIIRLQDIASIAGIATLADSNIFAHSVDATDNTRLSDVLPRLMAATVTGLPAGKFDGQVAFAKSRDGSTAFGGGHFKWVAASTATVDSGTIFAVTGVTTGRWIRIFTGPVWVEWFGAVGDGVTNDAPAINAAVAASNWIAFRDTTYATTTSISIQKRGVSFDGHIGDRAAYGGSVIQYSGNAEIIVLGTDNGQPYDGNYYDGMQGFKISNMALRAGGAATNLQCGAGQFKNGTYGLRDWRGGDINLENVLFENLQYGFWGVQSDINTFKRPRFNYCSVGMYLGPRCDQNLISDLYGFGCDTMFDIDRPADTWIMRPVIVNCGYGSNPPINVRQGTTRTLIHQPWCEFLAAFVSSVDSFVNMGCVAGYNGITSSCVGIEITQPFVYTNTLASGFPHAKWMATAGKCLRARVDEVISPAGQSVNLDFMVGIQASTSYDSTATTVEIRVDQANRSRAYTMNGTSGTPGMHVKAWGFGQETIANPSGRLVIENTTAGVATGGESMRISQSSTAGGFVVEAPTYTGGQTTRLFTRKSIQHGSAAPTTGTWEANDTVINSAGTHGSNQFWVCTTGGTPGTWEPTGTIGAYTIAASATYDPPSIAAAGTTTTTVITTGAVLGDFVVPSFSLSLAGLMMTAYVSAADTTTVVLFNPTAGAIDLASGTLFVRVWKR